MSKTAFYYLSGQIEGLDKAWNSLYLYFKGNDVLLNPGVTFIQLLKTEKSVEING